MDVTISIPPEMQDKLEQRAIESGQDVTEYIEKLIEKDLTGLVSLRDLYAPVRRQIQQSGISEDELDALIEKAREEAYQERKRKAGER
ncbi:MAG TPA: hypothetical protein VGL29_04635 [Blastocatellia bacterium]|jgi:hypothetical protein